ncbi:MAG: hypothetical protein WCN92_03325 [Eubacteriales bacterium]
MKTNERGVTMLCSLCKAEIDDGQIICPDCKLYALMKREDLSLQQQQKQQQEIKALKKTRRRYIVFTCSMIAFVIILFVGFYTIPYHATYSFPGGSSYSGGMKAFKLNGYGTFTSSDGSKYVGEWKNDRRNGQGTYFDKDGSIINSGEWQDGEFVG